MTIKEVWTELADKVSKIYVDNDVYPPKFYGGFSYPLGGESKLGKSGMCQVCQAQKSSLVNNVCLECQTEKRKGKYVKQ